jgi:hypothetical protein
MKKFLPDEVIPPHSPPRSQCPTIIFQIAQYFPFHHNFSTFKSKPDTPIQHLPSFQMDSDRSSPPISGPPNDRYAQSPAVAVFLEWQSCSVRIINHRFSSDTLRFYIDNSGWTCADDTPQEAQDLYWRVRMHAFPRVKVWPHEIIEVRAVVQSTDGNRSTAYIVRERVGEEECVRMRGRDEEWSEGDIERLALWYERSYHFEF